MNTTKTLLTLSAIIIGFALGKLAHPLFSTANKSGTIIQTQEPYGAYKYEFRRVDHDGNTTRDCIFAVSGMGENFEVRPTNPNDVVCHLTIDGKEYAGKWEEVSK